MLPARFKRWLEQLLHTHDTPHRTALAYAVGVFFGFSPVLGLHTVLGLAIAFLFGLNRIAVVLGIYSNLPWILPAYYTLTTLLGAAILRVQVLIVSAVTRNALAACSNDQPRTERSSRIAILAVGG